MESCRTLGSPIASTLDGTYLHPAEYEPRQAFWTPRTTPDTSPQSLRHHSSLFQTSAHSLGLFGAQREAPGPSIPLTLPVDVATHLDGATSPLGTDTHDAQHVIPSSTPPLPHDASMSDPSDFYVALAALGDRSQTPPTIPLQRHQLPPLRPLMT